MEDEVEALEEVDDYDDGKGTFSPAEADVAVAH